MNTTASSSLYKLQKLLDIAPAGSKVQEIRTLAKLKDGAGAAIYDDEVIIIFSSEPNALKKNNIVS